MIVLAQVQPLIAAQADRPAVELDRVAAPLVRPRTVVGTDGGFECSTITPGSQQIDRTRAKPGRFIRLVVDALGARDADASRAAHEELIRPWDEGGYGSTRNMAEGAGSTGGYATPVIYETQFFEVAAEQEVIVPFADEKPLGARQVEWPALNQYTAPVAGQSAWFGGVQVYRKGEKSQRTESDLSLKKISMVAQDN